MPPERPLWAAELEGSEEGGGLSSQLEFLQLAATDSFMIGSTRGKPQAPRLRRFGTAGASGISMMDHGRRDGGPCALAWVALLALLAPARADAPGEAARRVPPPSFPAPGREFHVAPGGDDANPGTEERPFATLERARGAVRELRASGGLPPGGVAVLVRGGDYPVRATLRLGSEDSGAPGAPVVYRARSGETPRFLGGGRVAGFRKVEDPAILARLPEEARGKVLFADLRASGVEKVPPLVFGGFASGRGFRTHPAVEVFHRGRALPLARWPNEGFARAAGVAGADGRPAEGGVREGRILYEGDRPRRWVGEPEAWLYGYWFYDWADSYERVASIDAGARRIDLEGPFSRYGYRAGARYRALNLLSEIDEPGEWHLDRRDLRLYLWPPPGGPGEGPETGEFAVEISLLDRPFLELDGASHLAFLGLSWELGAADGIAVRGGERCLFAGCAVRRLAGNGIEIRGGIAHGVLSSEVESLGRGGIVLAGGDRRTLAPGGHFVENCHIRDLSRIDHTYTPGVLVDGVGNRVAHNLVHGVASSAFRVEGNDHRIELNEVFDVLLESDDQGGADMFGDPTYRGVVFAANWWHHIGRWRLDDEQPACGQAGIRLDDAISGVLVIGNIFEKCSAGALGFGGVQIHGGKENAVEGNLFVDCRAAVSFSAWGERRWREYVRDFWARANVDRDLYLARYPELARLEEDHDANRVTRNVAVRCGTFILRDPGRLHAVANWVVPDGAPEAKASIEALAGARFPTCAEVGFRPIPLEEIGLYADAYRRSLPEELLRRARER